MCGIFGYVGDKLAGPLLVDGLTALEYRGYDSAGIFVYPGGVLKEVGQVANLQAAMPENFPGTIGIAHTRWATHGQPSKINCHPHSDCGGNLWLVHNGIIENYKDLKSELMQLGHKFVSETDSEVLSHLIEENLKKCNVLDEAVAESLKQIRGTYGIAVMRTSEPDKIVVARMGSPIVLGIGEGENFVASDPSAILRHTKNMLYLEDGEMAVITETGYRVFGVNHEDVVRQPDVVDWDIEQVQKGGYEHFMLKEIMEGPEVLRNSARGRIVFEDGAVKLGGLEEVAERLAKIERIILVACGSAYYAAVVGKYMIEEYAGIPVEVEIGSEFRYRRMVFDANTAILAVSQSGETADTLASIKEAKRKGLLTLSIVNTVGSTIARETEAGVYNYAGPEIGVASTKAFISQLEVLALFTVFLGRQRDMSLRVGQILTKEIMQIPDKVSQILERREDIAVIAEKYANSRDFLFMGRKYNFPIAYEGALKLKEVSYIHAEGYGAGEMKHGPIAMIDENFPTMAIAMKDSVYDKMISNIQEIKARGGKVIALTTQGNQDIEDLVDDVIYVPPVHEMLSPILAVVPLQLFAYYFGIGRKFNVDRPRNLAKSVTVE